MSPYFVSIRVDHFACQENLKRAPRQKFSVLCSLRNLAYIFPAKVRSVQNGYDVTLSC